MVALRTLFAISVLFASLCAAGQKLPKLHTQATNRMRPAQPLTAREQVEQLLDRFTYGARPGEIDRVLASGEENWLEAQLVPGSIPDAVLQKRLADLPTVGMSPAQALAVFPDRAQVGPVAQGKVPMPTDPLQRAVMEVQIAKWNAEQDAKKPDGSRTLPPELTDAEKSAQKKVDAAAAARLAGVLFALPKDARMTAVEAWPVADRIVLTGNGNLQGEQRNTLLADFSPREREAFQAMSAQVNSSGNLANELAQVHMLRDILSERQLETVMTDFWFNHFNIFIGKDSDQWYTATYEREAIRPHALGKFRDLLLATATSPAMLVYLDNYQSIGPDSLANGVSPANPKAKRGNRGLNENYGREVMELHTVGVNGGYSQADVTSLAAMLTGWGVDKPGEGGPFVFDPKRHQPGTKAWFGSCISDGGVVTSSQAGECAAEAAPATPASVGQGVAALKLLAASPKTAHFIATMLAQYFVADALPESLVDRLTKTYMATDGDISELLRVIAHSPEFNSRQYFHTKVKTPVEFLASAFRATGTDPVNLGALVNEAKVMGMPLYYALPPTGYYLTASQWMNSTALVDRLNFAYQLTGNKLPNQHFDGPRLLAQGLLSPTLFKGLTGSTTLTTNSQTARQRVVTLRPAYVLNSSSETSGAPGERPSAAPTEGSAMAIRVLEITVSGGPVSGRTDGLIKTQVALEPPNATASDTLNLITGLLLGSPEFQLR